MRRLVSYIHTTEATEPIKKARELIGKSAPTDLLPVAYHAVAYRNIRGWTYSELAEIRWLLIEAGAPTDILKTWIPIV